VHKKESICKQLSIGLAEKDVEHLKMFKEHINFDGKLYNSVSKHSLTNPNWKDSYKNTICISSIQIFDDLKRFNIVPTKTHIYKIPEWLIDHKYINHFIRGYFDGDGCIWFHKGLTPKAGIEFRGTLDMLNQIKSIFERDIHINSKVIPKIGNGIYQLKFSGNRICQEISLFLYRDSTIYM